MKKIDLIAATRPNFMKIAPLMRVLDNEDWCKIRLIHTGQHYDKNMSDIFFKELKIRKPDINLGVGGGSHAEQTGKTMIEYEKLLVKERPDLTIVVGDVNATLSCSLAAKKLHVPVGHVEGGLRSGDMKMPEEVNRILTDHISDILWTTSKEALKNLHLEAIDKNKTFFVGDIMIDTFEHLREEITKSNTYKQYAREEEYVLMTLHRPRNVDSKDKLKEVIRMQKMISEKLNIVYSVHPRTENNLKKDGLWEELVGVERMFVIPPQGYIDFMNLLLNSKFVISDSGSIQTETTYLGIPCITVRDSTERPQTITHGTNVLAEISEVIDYADKIMSGNWKKNHSIEGWDGKASHRIQSSLKEYILAQ